MTQLERYIGIDYSNAETPCSSLKGLRVYLAGVAADGNASADECAQISGFFHPPLSPPLKTLAQVEGWILGVTG
jgi:hypothetical protein